MNNHEKPTGYAASGPREKQRGPDGRVRCGESQAPKKEHVREVSRRVIDENRDALHRLAKK